MTSAAPVTELPVYRATIEPDWIDYNGHLRDAYYGLVASYAVDGVMDILGLDAAYRERTHCTLYTLEVHLHYLHEVKSSDDLGVISSVLDFDRKRIQVGCRFICSRVSEPVATAELMLLHVRQGDKPSVASFPDEVTAKLEALKISPDALEAFGPSSRKIELKRR
ncbi:MAG TPA: thioesterase family protein [Steroidobacteraceae bacterium]|jgi:acyl-CoA thioesterase FadM